MSYRLYLFTCVVLIVGCAGKVGPDKSDDLNAQVTALKIENMGLKMKLKQLAKYCNPNTDKDCPIENVF